MDTAGSSEAGHERTTDQVLDGLDLSGQRMVVTGASGGLGEETARSLAEHGAEVTLLGRRADALAEAATRIRATGVAGAVDTAVVDLADLASVRAGAAGLVDDGRPIDVLINNAGVMCCPKSATADGFEMQFGTNHVGHSVLTGGLVPALRRSDSPRVVTLSSSGHSIADVDLDDPNFERTEYDPWVAYGRSKTANALFALELARRMDGEVLSFSVHPGMILTDLGRHLTAETLQQMADRMAEREAAAGRDAAPEPAEMNFKSIPQGAATSVWAATAAELSDHNGAYLADCGVGVLDGDPGANGFQPHVTDTESASKLWTLTEELVGHALVV